MFCKKCGAEIASDAVVCVNCGVSTGYAEATAPKSSKTRLAFILLGVFLGGLGIHNFYAGYTGKGVAQLLISLFGWLLLFIPNVAVWIWVIIEVITVKQDAQGNPFA